MARKSAKVKIAVREAVPTKKEFSKARVILRREWGSKIERKLDDMLKFQIVKQFRISEEARKKKLEPKGLKVIMRLKSKKDIKEEERKAARGLSKKEKTKLLKEHAGKTQKPILGAIKRMGREVINTFWLTNSIVVDLTPEQIKKIAERDDIEFIEIDKAVIPELDVSAPAVKVNTTRANYGVSGAGVNVAVIGFEVDFKHKDLKHRVVRKRNYTSEAWKNPAQHGTLVAGIIAGNGTESSGTYVGMAPKATIWNYKIFPGATVTTAVQAIQDAATVDFADVINCSWGVSGTARDGTCQLCDAVDKAVRDFGAVIVKSAGNSGPGLGTTTCPANAHRVISVGALNNSGTSLRDFSSRGPTADGRPKPEIVAPGENIDGCKPGGGYASGSGTSFAAPHVAGIAALLFEKYPYLTGEDIREILAPNAADLTYQKNEQGTGRVNALASFDYFVSGVDVYIKDFDHDIGMAPIPGHYYSPDIWNRYLPDGIGLHKAPEVGQPNYAYVRIQNRGKDMASSVNITLWAALSAPNCNWAQDIGTITTSNLLAGQTRAIGPFVWAPPAPSHGCFKAGVDSGAQDPLDPNWRGIAPGADNNVAQRNMNPVDSIPNGTEGMIFFVNGLSESSSVGDLEIDITRYPKRGTVRLKLPRRYTDEGEKLKYIRVVERTTRKSEVQVTTTKIGKIKGIPLRAGEKSRVSMKCILPHGVGNEQVYPIIITQKIDGKEVGRVVLWISILVAPPYIANRNPKSMELHVADCIWVDKIRDYNKIPVRSLDDFLKIGYDGCFYCLKEYHTK